MTRTRTGVGPAVLAGCVLLAGCGGPAARPGPARPPAPHASFADRVCGAARQAGAKTAGTPLSVRVLSPDAAGLRCVLTGRKVKITIDSQAGPDAYTEFNTELSHQEQVFGPGVHEPGQIPSVITVPGSVVAVWIRAQKMVVATNATRFQTTTGAYVTVAVNGPAVPAALSVATSVARGIFAAHPNG